MWERRLEHTVTGGEEFRLRRDSRERGWRGKQEAAITQIFVLFFSVCVSGDYESL